MSRIAEFAGTLGRDDAGEKITANAHVVDGEAFAALYERHLPDIYSYLLAHTGRAEDAADLAQQVFMRALAAFPRYQQRDAPVSVWLFRIAHNLMVDFHRRRRPAVTWESLPESSHPAAIDDVEATVIGHEDGERLSTILARLDPAKRDLLALRFAAGLTVREIAAVLGRRDAAVRSELRRLLHALQEKFSHD